VSAFQLVLSKRQVGLDHFVQEWFIRHEAMRARPELVKNTLPSGAVLRPRRSSKEDET